MKRFLIVLCAITVLGAIYFTIRYLNSQKHYNQISISQTSEEKLIKQNDKNQEFARDSLVKEVLSPLITGANIYVNGHIIPTVIQNDISYVNSKQFADALEFRCLQRSSTVDLLGRERFEFSDGISSVSIGEKILSIEHAPFQHGRNLFLPVEDASIVMGLTQFKDSNNGMIYYSVGGGNWVIPENRRVAILEYHGVSNETYGIESMFIKPDEMEKQIAYLIDNGYDPIWFEDLRYIDHYDKPVILTFDDGYDNNYYELFPILEKYKVKATIFVVTGSINTAHTLTSDQITELSESGLVSIQSHGTSHGFMDVMDEAELRYDLGESQRILTELTGKQPYVVSYPEGRLNELTLQLAQEYYKFGTKKSNKPYETYDDPLLAGRVDILRDTGIEEFSDIINNMF